MLKRKFETETVVVTGKIELLTQDIWDYMFKNRMLYFGHAIILSGVSKRLRHIMKTLIFAPTFERFDESLIQFQTNVCQMCFEDNVTLIPKAWLLHISKNPMPVCQSCIADASNCMVDKVYRRMLAAYCEGQTMGFKWQLQHVVREGHGVHMHVVKEFIKTFIIPAELPELPNESRLIDRIVDELVKLILPSIKNVKSFFKETLRRSPLVPALLIDVTNPSC